MASNKAFKIHTFDIRKYSIYQDSHDGIADVSGDSQNLGEKQWFHYPQRTALSINFFWFVSTKSTLITIVWKGDTIDKTTIDPLNREIVSLVAKYPAIGFKQTDETGKLIKRFQISFSDEETFTRCYDCVRREISLPINALPGHDILRSKTEQIELPTPHDQSNSHSHGSQAHRNLNNVSVMAQGLRSTDVPQGMPRPYQPYRHIPSRSMTSTVSMGERYMPQGIKRPLARSATFALQQHDNAQSRIVAPDLEMHGQNRTIRSNWREGTTSLNGSQNLSNPYTAPGVAHLQSNQADPLNSQMPQEIQFPDTLTYSQLSEPYALRSEQMIPTAPYDPNFGLNLQTEVRDNANHAIAKHTKYSHDFSIYDLKDEKLKEMIKEKLNDKEFVEFVVRLDNLIKK